MKSMSHKLVANSMLSSITGMSNILMSFITNIIVVRLLGAEGTGSIALVLWATMIVVIGTDVGVGGSLARYLPELSRRNMNNEACALRSFLLRRLVLYFSIAFSVVLTMLLCFILCFGDVELHQYLTMSYGLVFFACCLSQVLFVYYYNLLRGTLRYDIIACLSAAGAVLQIAGAWAGSLLLGPPGALWGYVLGSLPMAAGVLTLSGSSNRLSSVTMTRVKRYSLSVWIAAVFSPLLWLRMDVVLIQYFENVATVGVFIVGTTISNLLLQGMYVVSAGLLPFLAQRVGSEQVGNSDSQTYATVLRISSLILFPICFGAAALTPVVIPLLYGSQFDVAVPVGAALAISSALFALFVIGSNALHAAERTKPLITAGVLGAIIMVIPGVAAVAHYGLTGAVLTRSVAQSVTAGYVLYSLNRIAPCSVPCGSLTKITVSSIASGALAFLCVAAIPSAWSLIIAVPVGVIVYLYSVRCLNVLYPDDIVKLHSAFSGMWRPVRIVSFFIINCLRKSNV